MATLVSPGVSVTVVDESAYATAGIGTIPLIMIATAANKLQPGSSYAYAPGTTAANANKLYLITSQRDLLQTFGTPLFYSSGGTPQYDNQLNELGLFSAYQYLGIATTSYVLRADIDLAQLAPTTTEPTGEAAAGQYWLDVSKSSWGIFQSNGNVNPALAWVNKTPTVLTSADNLDLVVQGSTAVGSSGSAAIITATADLVINGFAIPLTIGMSLADVTSAINNNINMQGLGISAVAYVRTTKPVVTSTAISDQYYLRLVSRDISTIVDLTGSNTTVRNNLGFATSTPTNVAAPSQSYLTSGSYVVDAYSSLSGTKKNNIWQKISIDTLDGNSTAWWYLVGSTDASYPGWGWREAVPNAVTGTIANPTFVNGQTCTYSPDGASPVTITVSGTTIDDFITSCNTAFNANSFRTIATKKTVGSNNYVVITNYDGTDMGFNDISTNTGTTHPWEDAGIPTTQTYYGSVTGTVSNPTYVAATRKVDSAVAVAKGTGYVNGDVLTVSGGTFTSAGQLTVTTIGAVTASVSAAGTGYAIGNTVTINPSGQGYTSPVILTVTSIGGGGSVTGLSVTSSGQKSGATPTNPVTPTSTSGGGAGLTVILAWGVGTVSASTPGNYTVDPTNPVSVTGGSGTGATFNLTMGYLTSNTFTIDPGTGIATTINVPTTPNNTVAGVAAAITAAFPSGPIVGSVSNNKLVITNSNNTQFTVKDVSGTPLTDSGIAVGVTQGRELVYQGFYPNLVVPSDVLQLGVGTVWINTTAQNLGADLVVKRYSGTAWVRQNTNPNTGTVPMYSSDAIANAAFGGGKGVGTIYAQYNSDGDTPPEANIVLKEWDGSAWAALDYSATVGEPAGSPADGTYWYNTYLQVDIMVGTGQIWKGYKNAYPATDPNGPIISGSQPLVQSDDTVLVDNDIWIDSSAMPYPVIYRYDATNAQWNLVDNTNHTSPAGIIFADARWNNNGYTDGSQVPAAMVVSNYVDSDAPNAELYPAGMLLFNTRYSTYNVKEYKVDYFSTLSAPYDTNAWVTASGNRPDGTPYMGSDAQRHMVVRALQASLVSNQEIRAEAVNFNLLATPGYIECLDEMITLNVDRKETAFIIADTPSHLAADGTSLAAWATNSNNAAENGPDGLISSSPYAAVYYPWALATNLDGQNVFVPPSEMALRTFAYNDQVAYPWFAPAGFNRGLVTGVTSVGYLKTDDTYQPVTLNQGQRDVLYINKINPITYIPGRGLVIYGQKTLNPTATALDRVNVARLINYMKYQLNNLAQPFLFEPNDQQTRQSVTNTFNSFMGNLVGLRALYDFAVVCDDTNNTPARIDANELWIDIAIKPEKAIEFIYIPIRILNTGDPMPGGNRNLTA